MSCVRHLQLSVRKLQRSALLGCHFCNPGMTPLLKKRCALKSGVVKTYEEAT